MTEAKSGDWMPGDGEREQHEIPDEGMYEAVIAEVPHYWKDNNFPEGPPRIQVCSVVTEIDSVDADGKRFVVASKPGKASFHEKAGLFKFMDRIGLSKQDVQKAGGINSLMCGVGIKYMVVHSQPDSHGIKYANLVLETLKASENKLEVSDKYELQFDRFPDSQWEHPEGRSNGDGEDDDGLPKGF